MDLAGTERTADSGAVGKHLDEMNKINDTLTSFRSLFSQQQIHSEVDQPGE